MSTNRINASIEFDYRGERYSTTATLNLDRLMAHSTTLPPLHDMLATKMGIDPWSYQYELLLAEDIRFAQAQGIAADYLQGENFDIAGFEMAWREQRILDQLQAIARQQLDTDDLEQQPALKAALLAAYQAGQNSTGNQQK